MRESVAYHEAGHAVAHVALRRGFRYVTLRPRTEGAAGLVYAPRCSDYPEPGDDDEVILLAGALAQARHEWLAQGGDLDEIEHDLITADTSRSDWQNTCSLDLTVHCEFAHDLLERNWASVDAVARSLLGRGTLQASEVRDLCGTLDERAAFRGAGLMSHRQALASRWRELKERWQSSTTV